MRITYFLLPFLLLALTAPAQELSYLEKSTSEDIFTSHNFHASAYHDGYFYLAGEFWKDIAFGDFSVAFPDGEDDMTWSFVLKVSETGAVADLWHFETEQFTRINQIVVDPTEGTLALIGQFRTNLVYEDLTLTSAYSTDGFLLKIFPDGGIAWSRQIASQSPVSFASGEALTLAADGTLYAGFEANGTITVEDTEYTYSEETIGAIIIAFTADGTPVQAQTWEMSGFETFIDLTAMTTDPQGRIVIGGGLTGEATLGDIIFGDAGNTNLQSFIVRLHPDLSLDWATQYLGSNSMVSNLIVFADQLHVTLEYANFLNVDDVQLTGSGSWRDLAVVAVDEDEQTRVVQNFRLAGNGGNRGVYAHALTEYLGRLYLGGMYQGVVINDEDFSLGVVGSADFQLPFLLALDEAGAIVDSYDFWGSQGPSRLRVLAASEHHLAFGGEFTQSVRLENDLLETVNSTLFYGGFLDGVINDIGEVPDPSAACLRRAYPTLVQDVLHVETDATTRLSIIDAAGRIVSSSTAPGGGSATLRIAELPGGVYYLVTKCTAGEVVVRFMKR